MGGQRVRAARLMFSVNTTISAIDWILQIEMLISPKFVRPGGVRIHNQKIHVNMNRNHVLDDAEMFLFLWGLAGKKSSNFGGISNTNFFPPGPRKLHYKFRRYLNFFFFPANPHKKNINISASSKAWFWFILTWIFRLCILIPPDLSHFGEISISNCKIQWMAEIVVLTLGQTRSVCTSYLSATLICMKFWWNHVSIPPCQVRAICAKS